MRDSVVVLLIPLYCAVVQSQEVLPGPAAPSLFPEWMANLTAWRTETLLAINFTNGVYTVPQLQWMQSSYIQPQVMAHDIFLYDRRIGEYTPDTYLDDLLARYGGIDSVLLWPTYPNLGIDNRNQFDLVRAMPGGVAAVAQFSQALLARGVRMMLPYNPWDTGTRYEGQSDDLILTQLLQDVQAYGFNGDTMYGIPESFFDDSVKRGWPVVLEPEVGMAYADMNWTPAGWGYWGEPGSYPFIPYVDAYKWLDARRMTHVCDRWATNHTDDIQHAFFNGLGFESWENIWGIWNQLSPRDSEATRRAAAVLRFFADQLTAQAWVPHSPAVLQSWTVFASMFPLTSGSSNSSTVWLLVNRGSEDVSGPQLSLPVSALPANAAVFDAYHGVQLKPVVSNGQAVFSFDIEGLGFGALYITTSVSQALLEFLDTMATLTATPLSAYATGWQPLLQTFKVYSATAPRIGTQPGMQFIPSIADFPFIVSGVEIEGRPLQSGMDFQYPWEPHANLQHNQTLEITAFYMDTTPVTNAQYATFVQQSGYAPRDSYNFLADWVNGSYPTGWQLKPVTWVSLADSAAYCEYYGKRLPNEWEWQYAAQGPAGNLYPWGNAFNASNVPVPDTGRVIRAPDDVGAHSPGGDSVFGVADLVGNVWQWCNEAEDTHTRAAVLRGTSFYQPIPAPNEDWYFPVAYELDTHGKYLLLSDSYDRAGTLGFRCVADAINNHKPS